MRFISSILATALDGSDEHNELGFMTGKPFHEETGFVEFDKPKNGPDLVGIEMVSNTGMVSLKTPLKFLLW